jgi:hypothetical protein
MTRRMSNEEYDELVEAGVFRKIELIDGEVRTGRFRLAFSPAQRAAAAELGIELPPDETVEEHRASSAESA